MRKTALLFFILSALSTKANVDPQPGERSPMTALPGRFGILLGGAQNEATGSTFTWQQMTLTGGYAIRKELTSDLTFFTGLNYRYTHIDQGRIPTRDRLGDLHDFILPLTLNYQADDSRWSFFAQVSGQLATDFSSVTSDDLDWTFRIGGNYQFSEHLSINFGVARVRNFADTFILPAVGVVWEPCDDWAFTLVGPRITLSHRVCDNIILRAGGFPTGGLWNVESDDSESIDYGLASYNVGAGIDYKLRRGIWLTLWAGTNFTNTFRAEQNGDTLFEDDLNPGWFAYLGLNIYEW
ncbi:MAG: DUF6268 family outer membrane beta-barrel protein [Akkermansiaceae bacterium]